MTSPLAIKQLTYYLIPSLYLVYRLYKARKYVLAIQFISYNQLIEKHLMYQKPTSPNEAKDLVSNLVHIFKLIL